MEILLTLVILWAVLSAVLALESDVLAVIWKRVRSRDYREVLLVCFAAPVMCVLLCGEYAWNKFVRRKKTSELE